MTPDGRRSETATGSSGIDRRRVAGGSLAVAGIVATLGITVAGTLYPGYSIHSQTISALGATDASGQLVQPAATAFTLVMVTTGGLVILAGVLGREPLGKWLAGSLTVTGIGVFGVALFPAHVGPLHALAALVAFGGGGVTALIAARKTSGLIRWLSAVLGVITLFALVAFISLGGATPLGRGGLERLVSLPIQCWTILFGGWLFGTDADLGD